MNLLPPPPVANIMIVDDHPENLRVLGRLLRTQGYDVRPAPSGKIALRAAAGDPPDLILLDVMMPEIDGYEVCRQLKADPLLRKIPVLFISARDKHEDKVLAFKAGAVDYVTKPFQFEEVNARITTHLELRRLQIEMERYNRRLEERVAEQVKEISDSQMATILALAKLAQSRDDDTGNHIERIQFICRMLAIQLQEKEEYRGVIDQVFIDNLSWSSPLHDIGKVGIPDAILLKPGRLTAEEFEIMKTHTVIGSETLKAVNFRYSQNSFLNMGIIIARSHHERWDGSGYPDGLAGDGIPLAAQVVATADVYDALRSERPYKVPFSHEKSRDIILQGSGTHFSPAVAGAFAAAEQPLAELYERLRNS